MLTDTIIEDARWRAAGLERLAETAAVAALRDMGLDPTGHEIAVLGCDDARIAVLNTDFRGKPTATNVLSWPSEDLAPEVEGATPDLPDPDEDAPHHLGDIAIAWETCAREAAEMGLPLEQHVTHLIVHGVLHLLGYDHMRDGDATLMERREAEILGKMGLPDPYCLDSAPDGA